MRAALLIAIVLFAVLALAQFFSEEAPPPSPDSPAPGTEERLAGPAVALAPTPGAPRKEFAAGPGVALEPPAPPVEARPAAPGRRSPGVATQAPPPEEPDGKPKIVKQTVVVLDPDKNPLADALVSGRMAEFHVAARRTNDHGEITIQASEFEGVHALERLTLVARHWRYGRQGKLDVVPSFDPVTVTLERVPTGTIRGRITTKDGKPPEAPTLIVATLGIPFKLTTKQFRYEPDGRFELEIVPGHDLDGGGGHWRYGGAWRARFTAPGFCPTEWKRLWIAVEPPGSRSSSEEARFPIEREAVLTGVITRPGELPYGKPLVVMLELETSLGPGATTSGIRPVTTDERGSFRLGEVRSGWHKIRATFERHVGPWASVDIEAGQTVENFTLHLDPPGNFQLVRGTLRGRDGPVEGALLTVFGAATRSDEKGAFALRTTRGSSGTNLGLRITCEGYESLDASVKVPDTDDPAPVTLFLKTIDGAGVEDD